MNNHLGNTEHLDEIELTPPGQKTISDILREAHAKQNAHNAKRDKKKKGHKRKRKEEREAELDRYNQCLDVEAVLCMGGCNPFMGEQQQYRKGNVIPEVLEMGLYDESGVFFGTKYEPNGFVGKPANEDGHILITGFPGSGKTMGIVIPTMMTWRGCQIILDVKCDLYRYWLQLNKHTGKKVLVFGPGGPAGYGCRYDPYALLRQGGTDNLPGNARDLALALIPLLPSDKDSSWIKAAQNFLTGAIIYYFSCGQSFVETMVTIQLSSILDIMDEVMEDGNDEAKTYMSKLSEVSEKVICNIGMELSNLAALVTDPAVRTALSPEESVDVLDWSALNSSSEPFDVILEIPEANLERWRPMLLLMVNQLIKSLEKRPPRTYKTGQEMPPVLVMLDEFSRIGTVSAITNGLATLRSRGVTFALFVQSMADLAESYGNNAFRKIADDCAYKVVLGVADADSQQYFSKLVGTTKSLRRSINANCNQFGRASGYNRNISETREPIIQPEEFLTLDDVVVITPKGYFRVNKTLFVEHEEWFLMPQLLKNPDYLEKHPFTFSYQ